MDPWGDDWDQAAMIGSICSVAGSNKRFDGRIPASDLTPRVKREASMSDDQVTNALMSMVQQCSQFGGVG